MIREFWADNYKSIRDKQVLNFECKSNEESVASVEVGNGVRLNKLGIIFGANASGKSNMLYALQNVFDILFHSCAKKEEEVNGEGPFALRKDNQPPCLSLFMLIISDMIIRWRIILITLIVRNCITIRIVQKHCFMSVSLRLWILRQISGLEIA